MQRFSLSLIVQRRYKSFTRRTHTRQRQTRLPGRRIHLRIFNEIHNNNEIPYVLVLVCAVLVAWKRQICALRLDLSHYLSSSALIKTEVMHNLCASNIEDLRRAKYDKIAYKLIYEFRNLMHSQCRRRFFFSLCHLVFKLNRGSHASVSANLDRCRRRWFSLRMVNMLNMHLYAPTKFIHHNSIENRAISRSIFQHNAKRKKKRRNKSSDFLVLIFFLL